MCGSDPAPPAPVAPKTPVASDPNSKAIESLLGVAAAGSADNPALRKSLNIDLSSAGSSGSGLSIPQ